MGEIVRVKHSEHGSCQVEILICTGGVPVYFLFFLPHVGMQSFAIWIIVYSRLAMSLLRVQT